MESTFSSIPSIFRILKELWTVYMESSLLIAFWGLSIALVMTPGADWAYAIAAGMRDRALMPAVAGMLIGYLLITAVVAAGLFCPLMLELLSRPHPD